MMIKVTKHEFEQDLKNTQEESRAYGMLAEGHRILARLPENAGPTAATHNFKASSYLDKQIQCNNFLSKLRAYGKDNF